MRRKFVLSFFVVAFAMGLFSVAYGSSGYKNQFNARYGTAGSAIDSCLICHTSTTGNGSNVGPYGNAYANANYDFAAIEPLDSDGDGFTNIAEITARTFPGDPNSKPTAADTTKPTVSAFTIPATSSTLAVSITSLTATDNVAVTGYMVTESAAAPTATAAGWTAAAPTSHTFTTAGAKTLYAWAKDAAGNVSTSRSASVTITLPPAADTTKPTVSAFTIPATSSTLAIAITSLTATDNVGVTGYTVTESATAPTATASGWTAAAPLSYTFATAGAKTLYAWAKDAAGNVSTSRSAAVTITLPPAADTTKPTVTAFTIPATATALAVSITSFTATDNVGVTGYTVTESATAPTASAAGWTATAPTSHSFASAGAKTLYAWAKDAAGNVSTSRSASVTITVTQPPAADTTKPTVTAFTIPATASTFAVPITSFAATDNVGVTGFRVTESATAPTASAAGWTAAAPTSYSFATAGAKTLYAWAKDAAGNVSASRSASVTITASTPPPTTPPPGTGTGPDMTGWVGKWFKITEKDSGYRASKSTLTQDNSSVTAYLKIYDWDPSKSIFHVDRYEYDSVKKLWSSESIDLQYISGSQKKFLCWYQVTDNAAQKMTGFTVLIQQGSSSSDGDDDHEDEHESNGSTFKTLGGYYAESGQDSSGSSVSYVGGLTITGSEVAVSSVPVPSKNILR